MDLWRMWALKGPNIWAACPIIEAGLDFRAWSGESCEHWTVFHDRLRTLLPSFAEDVKCVENAASLAYLFPRLVVHLQVLAGNPVRFSAANPTENIPRYRIAFEYQEEPVGRACLHVALALCRAIWESRSYGIDEELARLRRLAEEQRLEPSILALVEAARARQIPVDHFHPDDTRYLRLGQGARQHCTLASETDDISALARSVATNKHLTQLLLRQAGVPVPPGRPVVDAEDAWTAACELGLPVTVEPHERMGSLGVRVKLRTREQVLAAYAEARAKSTSVLVERFLSGMVHCVLVVEGRVVAVARNLDNGDRMRDATEGIHPETATCAVAAAQALRLRIAGVDVVAQDIRRPLEEQGGAIVAVNTNPDLSLHTAPGNDHPRAVGAAIVASLFPAGSEGRIPILAVVGSRAPVAGRCLAALLTDAGQRVGRVSREGVFIAGRKINLEGMTAYEKARAVLHNVLVDVAVLECDSRDLLCEGFVADRCDVVLATETLEGEDDHTTANDDTQGSVEEVAGAWIALLNALAPHGKAVLNADDPPRTRSLLPSADRLVWFGRSGDNLHLSSHRAGGGTAVFLSADSLVIARGIAEQRLAFGARPVQRDPREHLALLAALAGAMSLNQCGDENPVSTPSLPLSVPATLSVV